MPPAQPPAGSDGARRPPRRDTRAAWAVLLLSVGVGAGAFGASMALRAHPAVLKAAVPVGGRASTAQASALPPGFTPVAVPAAAGLQARPAGHIPPVEVAIPAIRVTSELVGLRLDATGALQVPQDYGVAGWYSDGAAPGDTGAPAVIVGHVDSHAGPGVFYRLPQLRTGDVVFIRRGDGATLAFTVYRVADYTKDGFPARAVYGPTRRPELRLLTCTGVFDSATGHYLSNDVVYAALSASTPTQPAPARHAPARPAPAPAHPARHAPAPRHAVPTQAGRTHAAPKAPAPSPALLTPTRLTSSPLGSP